MKLNVIDYQKEIRKGNQYGNIRKTKINRWLRKFFFVCVFQQKESIFQGCIEAKFSLVKRFELGFFDKWMIFFLLVLKNRDSLQFCYKEKVSVTHLKKVLKSSL